MSHDKQNTTLYKPNEVAKRLGCSEWWVKEQARRRRIPFSWIGGSYRFTEAHIEEIVSICEKRPLSAPAPTVAAEALPRGKSAPANGFVVNLRSRSPRRARAAEARSTAA